MDLYEKFRDDLRDGLNHLHDPDYHADPTLAEIITGGSAARSSTVQYAIIQAIRNMKPPPDTLVSAPIHRCYDLLVHRFIEGLTQDETADRMASTVRNIRREQRVATHILARFLWEHRGLSNLDTALDSPTTGILPESNESQPRHWRSQARQELASLRQSNPAAVSDVGNIVRRAVELERTLVESYGVALVVGEISDVIAAVHPTALLQVLIMAIGQLSRSSRPREIRIDAREETNFAVLRLRGIDHSASPMDDKLTSEMLELLGGSLAMDLHDNIVEVVLQVPAVGKVNVVVVDDNQDFIHFCRRCVQGTRFHILQPADWTAASIQASDPDVILLDIMLPDVDGWELLQDLQHEASTASIPVVVCSIVLEQALASAMGAIKYLPKPILHQDLITTLELVTNKS